MSHPVGDPRWKPEPPKLLAVDTAWYLELSEASRARRRSGSPSGNRSHVLSLMVTVETSARADTSGRDNRDATRYVRRLVI